eukprot:scaffold114128_cov18-Tisochrysis_lutea.AAC.2
MQAASARRSAASPFSSASPRSTASSSSRWAGNPYYTVEYETWTGPSSSSRRGFGSMWSSFDSFDESDSFDEDDDYEGKGSGLQGCAKLGSWFVVTVIAPETKTSWHLKLKHECKPQAMCKFELSFVVAEVTLVSAFERQLST